MWRPIVLLRVFPDVFQIFVIYGGILTRRLNSIIALVLVKILDGDDGIRFFPFTLNHLLPLQF